MSTPAAIDEIRTEPCPDCYLCGAKGELLYENLKDRLFGAPGEWTQKKCPAPDCGLVWLDPMPVEEDIWKAYRTYYTHAPHTSGGTNLAKKAFGLFRKVIGLERRRFRLNTMYLADKPPGKLLDVGCGNGERMKLFASLGWEVEGQEVDPVAVTHVQNKLGYKVHEGLLTDLNLSEATFDAIIMNHVIEHTHDPVALLNGCHRLLKPMGYLVATTPNIASLGHHYFGSVWRGLEPPRHIHLFSPDNLKIATEQAGFDSPIVFTDPAHAEVIAGASFDIRRHGTHNPALPTKLSTRIRALAFQIAELFHHSFRRQFGEELLLIAKRQA